MTLKQTDIRIIYMSRQLTLQYFLILRAKESPDLKPVNKLLSNCKLGGTKIIH